VIHCFTLRVGYAVVLGAAEGVTVGTRLAWQVARWDNMGMASVVLKEELEAKGVEGTKATEELEPGPSSSVMSSSSYIRKKIGMKVIRQCMNNNIFYQIWPPHNYVLFYKDTERSTHANKLAIFT